MAPAEQLIDALRNRPNLPAADLTRHLGVSRATLSRLVRAAGPRILSIGRARRRSYAARRTLRGDAAPLPIFRIDEKGASEQVAELDLAYPDGCVVVFNGPSPWPLDDPMRDGWFDGLPYFLQDLRPGGFLGRRFARTHARALQVGDDPRQWTDDDVLHALSLLGADQSGNLILGEAAFRLWLDQIHHNMECLAEEHVPDAYVELAKRMLQEGGVDSSVAGEFPKFTAVRMRNGAPCHVLVKFSGSGKAPDSRRWSDLLVCEHLAAQTLAKVRGLIAEETSVVQAGDHTFLEAVRFDRHASRGRSSLCSWAAFNHGWFGLAGPGLKEAQSFSNADSLISTRHRQLRASGILAG